MSTKLMLLSIGLAAPALLLGASAFVPPSPSRRVAADPSAANCNANRRRTIRTDPLDVVICTKLRAGAADGNSDDTPKATSKGAQSKEPSKKNAIKSTAKSKSSPTGKRKGAQKSPNKKPLEISQSAAAMGISEVDGDDQNYAYNIPTTGYSLADRLEEKGPDNKERFETTLTPIVTGIQNSGTEGEVEILYDGDGFPTGYKEVVNEEDGGEGSRHQGVARIDTISTLGNVGEEPVRWLVSLGDTEGEDEPGKESYALVDLPPYSDRLADEIRSFMDPTYNATSSSEANGSGGDYSPKATLDVILLTNRECIHYDSSPGVYVTRKSDMAKWKKAFPEAEVVMYRLDVPRECRDEVTQVLDGYGPWGWDEASDDGSQAVGGRFVETGRPLTIEEWDEDTKTSVLDKGALPPDDQVADDKEDYDDDDESLYSSEAIRRRERKHRLLAVYTPGHTFGSVSYVFPKRGICCSGYALPLESAGEASQVEGGPRLDYRGYLATSASRPRQMSSASSLINKYVDRFTVVLPARGDVVFLDSDEGTRRRELTESVGLYEKIGEIYGRLGIVE